MSYTPTTPYMGATYTPGANNEQYELHHSGPALIAPEPQRINHDMPNQIADGLRNLDFNAGSRSSTMSTMSATSTLQRASTAPTSYPTAHLSPFPKLVNPPPNVPPSDAELEERLESARVHVLNSNDPEMQLAWAQDALAYCGICAEETERLASLKPAAARPQTPRVEHQLKMDAMNVVNFLAEQHHPQAEFLRGLWLEWGRFGQREDKKEAFRCYSRAADKNYARAEYRIGMLYESYNDPMKALRHYARGVEAGDAASSYRLGMMTLRGQNGVSQDFAKGVELVRRAAEGADENAAQGAYVYGMMLLRQLPQVEVPEMYLPLDERLARENIEKAAYMKFAKAQVKMGSAYELGAFGCEFSPALSVHYNALASKQGEAEADMALSKWFLVGAEGVFPKNEAYAYTYAERAAHSSFATAEFALGYFHEVGVHVPVNLDKALEWYEKAAQHGNDDAKGRIESLSRNAVLSKRDHESVAVSRIKSQHGSKRGARPERFRQQPAVPRLDQVEENPYTNGRASTGPPPPRGSSLATTPYPADNPPPPVPPHDMHSAAVPYPLNDGPPVPTSSLSAIPPAGYNPAGYTRPTSAAPPQMRPSSAFQINPEIRANSAAPQPLFNNRQHVPPPNSRPQPPAGQQYPPYDPHQPPPQQHYPPSGPGSRPPPSQRIVSGPPGTQQYARLPPNATPRPGHLQHSPTAPGYGNPGRPDIGYNGPPPAPPPHDQQQRPPSARPPPQQQQSYDPGRQNGPLPPRGDSRVSSAPNARPSTNAPAGASANPNMTAAANQSLARLNARPGAPGAAAGAGAGANATPSAQPVPSKGPKTFEEMGVPNKKEQSECVVM